MLPKEAEGTIGAMGVASSFASVEGLVMDLGGGSTQITWMIAKDGHVQTSPKGSISFPYGAAAMTRKLRELSLSPPDHNGHHKSRSPVQSPQEELEEDMKAQFRQAYDDLDLPDSLRHKARHGGLTLYLSGGGFRGWGYLLMSQHKVSPYPIPIINGFCVTKREFQQTGAITAVAAEESVFRISKRRAEQVPAVAFLVNVLVDALPMIQQVRFCQGGVREGFLFDTLDAPTKALDPLAAATAPYGHSSAADLAALLWDGLPGVNHLDRSLPASFTPALVRAVADMMYLHLPLPKETRSLAALHAPLTGVLTAAHGVAHAARAILALALCARWNVDLPPPHEALHARLRAVLTHQEGFWASYLGALAGLLGTVYPAGHVDPKRPRIRLAARWADGLGKKGLSQGVVLDLKCRREDPMTVPLALNPLVDDLEKVGKKKNRVGGEHGFGVPVQVEIERTLI
ncbi:hypothetical protein CLAIMM_11718 [Cladophialophora immunda]|nr:hypothetical protein CLAIMM_11718 [Cladophialophora immunda]